MNVKMLCVVAEGNNSGLLYNRVAEACLDGRTRCPHVETCRGMVDRVGKRLGGRAEE